MFSVLIAAAMASPTSPSFPLEETMAMIAEEHPYILEVMRDVEADLDRVGEVREGWQAGGRTIADIYEETGNSVETHLLGEFEVGGHSVRVPGNRPLMLADRGIPHRYDIMAGPEEPRQFSYYSGIEGVVIETWSAPEVRGTASCSSSFGLAIHADKPWEEWGEEQLIRVAVFAEMNRQDTRTYCIQLQPDGENGYAEVSYDQHGRPHLHELDSEPRIFRLYPREEAIERLLSFGN